MTPDEARNKALGYAWGREDAREDFSKLVHAVFGAPTATRGVYSSGSLAFADAYARGQDDYDHQRRGSMITLREAYANWQDSGGRSIFARGELTLGEDERAELRGLWPTWFSGDDGRSAYYARQAELQAAAWDALS